MDRGMTPVSCSKSLQHPFPRLPIPGTSLINPGNNIWKYPERHNGRVNALIPTMPRRFEIPGKKKWGKAEMSPVKRNRASLTQPDPYHRLQQLFPGGTRQAVKSFHYQGCSRSLTSGQSPAKTGIFCTTDSCSI